MRLTVTIPETLADDFEQRVNEGGYAHKNDYIRDLVRRDLEGQQ